MIVGRALGRASVLVGLVAVVVAGVCAPAGAAPSWSLVGTAPGALYGHADAVSCPTPTTCLAVGTLDLPHSASRLAERWDGRKWTALSTPNPTGAISSQLTSVKCTNATNCIAVGQYNTLATTTKTLAMRWDGKKWSILNTPNAPGSAISVLSGVACSSSTSCFAVGGYFVSTMDSTNELTLVEQWNGSTWSIVPSPNQPLAVDSSLTGVTCASSTLCFAVGSYDTLLVTSSLIEQWDGASWSVVSNPNPKGASESQLSSVTCTSTTNCFAVGLGRGTLVERWNGALWGIVASPNPAGATGASLTGVSCPSASHCVAVGIFFRQTVVQRLVETWNGAGWSLTGVPLPSGTKLSNLSGISCSNTASCFAVGDFRLGPSRRPLFERYS